MAREIVEVETTDYGKKVEIPAKLYEKIKAIENSDGYELDPELEKLGFELIGINKYTTDPCGTDWSIAFPSDTVRLAIPKAKIYYSPAMEKIFVEIEKETDCETATGPCWEYTAVYAYPPKGKYKKYYYIARCGPDGYVEKIEEEIEIP